jgi:arginyl-tRNA synthetase
MLNDYEQGIECERERCLATIDLMINGIKDRLKDEGLDIHEWWSSEIFTGIDIDKLIEAIEDKKELSNGK